MDKEFSQVMSDLHHLKSTKNSDWYAEQLNSDYAQMRKNLDGSTTGSLVRKKGQNLKDQKAEVINQIKMRQAEMMKNGGGGNIHRERFTLNKSYEKLAEKNPLDFIDAVLANHPQNN